MKRGKMKTVFFLVLLVIVSMLVGCSGNNEAGITLTESGSGFFTYMLMERTFKSGLTVCNPSALDKSIYCELNKEVKMGEVLIDCANNFRKESSEYNFEGKHSCIFFSEQLRNFHLDAFLYDSSYEFTSKVDNEVIIDVRKGEGCPKNKHRYNSGIFPFNSENKVITSDLSIC